MNAQEIKNAVSIFAAMFGGILATHNIDISAAQWSQIASEMSVVIPALASLGSIGYSIYSHWNMKRVPEKSVSLIPIANASNLASVNPGDHVAVDIAPKGAQPATVAKVIGCLIAAFFIYGAGTVRAQTPTTPSINPAVQNIYSALNNIIGFVGGLVQADLNAAIADAQAQTPPNAAAIACWSSIAKIPQTSIPTGAGLAYLKQRFLDLQSLYQPLNLNCGSVAPLFLKQYNQFMALAAAQNL